MLTYEADELTPDVPWNHTWIVQNTRLEKYNSISTERSLIRRINSRTPPNRFCLAGQAVTSLRAAPLKILRNHNPLPSSQQLSVTECESETKRTRPWQAFDIAKTPSGECRQYCAALVCAIAQIFPRQPTAVERSARDGCLSATMKHVGPCRSKHIIMPLLVHTKKILAYTRGHEHDRNATATCICM